MNIKQEEFNQIVIGNDIDERIHMVQADLKESLEEKIKRINKYGMNEIEVFDDESSQIVILLAQINFLTNKLMIAEEGLEFIAGAIHFGDDVRDCAECAQETLEKLRVRNWKKS